MKYLYQAGIILAVTFIAEVLRYIIPLPVPASIYGLLLMLCLLKTGIISLRHVKETGNFLIEIMPLMFIPAAVGLLVSFKELKAIWIPVILIIIITTVLVMAVSGSVTQRLLRSEKREKIEQIPM
jgi:holin-like protein